ncbi:MAG: MATE family efflux transporter, partial [Planctomycetes bacterium]|nr:MATE family efflux transporter [Planctomycetota bacterium]
MSEPLNHDGNLKPQSPTLELLRLAAPIIGMTVSRMAMGFIDFVMVSQLGTEAQAAISPATLFVFALACLGMGAAQSVQTFVAQAEGRGEPEKGGSFGWQTYYIAAVLGLLTVPIVMTTEIWFGWIARVATHPDAVAALEIDYIRIALWSVAPSVVCAGLTGFFNGAQKPGVSLIAVLVSLAVNVIGNYLLIFGNFGFPEMGIAGAAVATLFAWSVRGVILTGAMLLPEFDRRYNTRHSMRPHWENLRGILRIGGPTAIMWMVDIGAWVVFMNLIIPPYGIVSMAATNVALQYMHVSFMPAIGVGMALCSQVGFAIGAGKPETAVLRAKVAARVTSLYMGGVGLLFLLGGYPLMAMLSEDPEVIRVGQHVLIWAAIFQVFDAMGITYMNALRGAGDTRWPAVVVALDCWVLFIGGGYACALWLPQIGLNGPWAMCMLYICLLGVLLWRRWRSGVWRSIKLFKEDPTPQPPEAATAEDLVCEQSAVPGVEESGAARPASANLS